MKLVSDKISARTRRRKTDVEIAKKRVAIAILHKNLTLMDAIGIQRRS